MASLESSLPLPGAFMALSMSQWCRHSGRNTLRSITGQVLGKGYSISKYLGSKIFSFQRLNNPIGPFFFGETSVLLAQKARYYSCMHLSRPLKLCGGILVAALFIAAVVSVVPNSVPSVNAAAL